MTSKTTEHHPLPELGSNNTCNRSRGILGDKLYTQARLLKEKGINLHILLPCPVITKPFAQLKDVFRNSPVIKALGNQDNHW